uniref:Uncharacterized protein n=1 Tax=viral metagenome TaxID=1070528 RepID=A0A6C0I6P3_9ZZZZ
MSLLSQPTQNVIDHIFTAAYSYTNVDGFQVQINTQLDGNVNIGNVNTSYGLLLNGQTISDIIGNSFPPDRWADYPAVNNVNMSGYYITNLSGNTPLTVNVCGGLIVTGTDNFGFSLGVGNLTVAIGNIVTLCGNAAIAGNIAVDGNANIGCNVNIGGKIKAIGGSIYNPKSFTVDTNGGTSNYTGSNYQGSDYIGLVTGDGVSASYLFLTTASSETAYNGQHVEIVSTNASSGNPLNLVVYNPSTSTYYIRYTICDRVLHEYVYFGAPTSDWIELY